MWKDEQKVIYVPIDKKPKYYTRFIGKDKYNVFDFHKIDKQGAFVNILTSPRGMMGKSLGAKRFAHEGFRDTGQASLYLVNTQEFLRETGDRFLQDVLKPKIFKILDKDEQEFWSNVKKVNAGDNVINFTYKGKVFVKMLNLNSPELMKTSRPDWYGVFYDEYNEKANKIKNPIVAFTTVLYSCYDPNDKTPPTFKIWLLGNNTTINVQLLNKLGVKAFHSEVGKYQVLSNGGIPLDKPFDLIFIISPKFTTEEKLQYAMDNLSNPVFMLATQLGTAGSSTFNESQFDTQNCITYLTEDMEYFLKNHTLEGTVFTQKGNYMVWHSKLRWQPSNSIFVSEELELPDGYTGYNVYMKPKDIVLGAKLNKYVKSQLQIKYERQEIYFDNISVRELFIDSII